MRMCELLVGLPDVNVLAVADLGIGQVTVHVETVLAGRPRCPRCATVATVKDRDPVELVDLPVFGRRARLVWSKRRWRCPTACGAASWTEHAPAIAASRLVLTDRAGRWVTEQVGRHGRTVAEVAADLGCCWHTVNDAVNAYGRPLLGDPARIGIVTALGLDETLFGRRGRFKTKQWSTSIVDVRAGRLLDVIEGRNAARRVPGSRHDQPGGATRSRMRRWTCRGRIGRCLTRCCPTPSRSPIRSMS